MLELTYEFQLTDNKTINCKQFTNKHLIYILKCLNSKNNQQITSCYNNVVSDLISTNDDNLSYIDKFLILLQSRINYINSYIEITNKAGTKSAINLKLILTSILTNFNTFEVLNRKNKTIVVRDDNIIVGCTLPAFLSYSYTLYDYIYYVQVGDNKIFIKNVTGAQLDELLQLIPTKLIIDIKRKLNKLNYLSNQFKLFEYMHTKDEKRKFYSTLLSKDLCDFLSLLFSDSVTNFYNLMHSCMVNLNLQPTEFLGLTPEDIKILIKTHNIMQEKNNQQNKQKNQQPQPGLGVKNL